MLARISLLAVCAALCAPAAATAANAPGSAASSAAKGCKTKRTFMAGFFFAEDVRARGVGCAAARRQVKRWGATEDCIQPQGPNDRTCRAGGYRCVTVDTGGVETFRVRCRKGRKRAVGFRAGS